jgi:hypothetical protein
MENGIRLKAHFHSKPTGGSNGPFTDAEDQAIEAKKQEDSRGNG